MDLKQRLAVVTGVSRGIGLATVNSLLEKGAKVAGWGRTKPELEHENFYFIPTDVSQYDQVDKAYEATKKHFKQPIDILVNNAGFGFQGAFETFPLDTWRELFDVNVHGLYYCSRLAVPDMKAQEQGHIINISSIAGTTGIETMAAYCGTKHAVRGISHSMYKELRNDGIKVTCIFPGSTQTNFFDNIPTVTANENMMQPEDIAGTIIHALESSDNYHHVDIEVRPLRPKGKKKA